MYCCLKTHITHLRNISASKLNSKMQIRLLLNQTVRLLLLCYHRMITHKEVMALNGLTSG